MPYNSTQTVNAPVPASPLFKYSIVVFLIGLADAVMAYSAPVYIESIVKNPAIMGLIIASSSFVGFWADVIIGQLFGRKRYVFFLFWTIFLGIFFPLSLILLPPVAVLFVISMAIWGIYFELLEFSHFHFIHEHIPPNDYDKSWSYLYVIKSVAYVIGPIIATSLILSNSQFPFIASLAIFLVCLLGYLAFHHQKHRHHHEPHRARPSLIKEFSVWMILSKKIWPVWVFTLGIFMVDAAFWTVGTLLSEQLKENHALGGYLIPAYILPFTLSSLITKKVSFPFGKKRAAFVCGLIGGALLTLVGNITNVYALLALVASSALFFGVAMPEIMAVSEDYVKRLGKFSNDMMGFERSAVSLAYLIGPIVAGTTSAIIGFHHTFSVIGGILVVISLIAIIFTPRKIFMPQSELKSIVR